MKSKLLTKYLSILLHFSMSLVSIRDLIDLSITCISIVVIPLNSSPYSAPNPTYHNWNSDLYFANSFALFDEFGLNLSSDRLIPHS